MIVQLNYEFESIIENIHLFENATFFEKLDIIAELFIRYDNDTLFSNEYMSVLPLISGYNFSNMIKRYMSSLK